MTRTMTCDGCKSTVRLTRREDRTLAVACDCDDATAWSVRVAEKLPREWSA